MAKPGVGPLLAAGLKDTLVPADRVAHRAAFGDSQRERLLAVDVLAGARRLDHRNRVPVIGYGDQHGVDVFARQQLTEVFVGRATLVRTGAQFAPVSPLDNLARRLAPAEAPFPIAGALAVYVAHRDYLHAFVLE